MSIKTSSSVIFFSFFLKSFTLQVWRIGWNLAPNPDAVTLNVVVETPYPIPLELTLIDESLPFSNIGVNSAPVPIPVTDIAGGELKSVPAVPTNTSTISPLWITADASPFLPVLTLTSHGLSKFKISEEP